MKNNLVKIIFALIIFVFSVSCDILRDFPFEVSRWTPGSGFHSNPSEIIVSVQFSHDPDKISVEKNFSMTGDGEQITGIYKWEGRKMIFLPFVPLELNKDYNINFSSDVRTTKGLSMENLFEGKFSTRNNYERPEIVAFNPEFNTEVDKNSVKCFLEFSVPVNINSIRDNVLFTPEIHGTWDIENEGNIAVFTPLDIWPQGKQINLNVSASLTAKNGMAMGKDFFTVFRIGLDREPPYLIAARRITNTGECFDIESNEKDEFIENSGWEKEDRLLLEFSKNIDLLTVDSAITTEGASILTLDRSDMQLFSRQACFYFEKPPSYNSRFLIKIKKGIRDIDGNDSNEEYLFRIFANGINSKPPSLVGIRIPMAPSVITDNAEDFQLISFGLDDILADLPIMNSNYPFSEKIRTWIELYFDCADNASINLFSLIEKFRVDTSNNVIQFSSVSVKCENFSILNPAAQWEKYFRIEISGTLTNTVNSGLVHFVVNQGLLDSKGNLSEKQFMISLIK